MWFLFGFITLIGASIYSLTKKLNASWVGTARSRDDVNFQYETKTRKKLFGDQYKVQKLLVGVEGSLGYDYEMKSESEGDKYFKSFGFSEEHQTGNQTFDDLVYVVSNDQHFLQRLSSSAQITQTVVEIFRLTSEHHGRVKSIRHNSGRFWVSIKPTDGFNDQAVVKLADKLAPLLNKVALEIGRIPPPTQNGWRDPFVIKAAIILALSSGLAINGGIQLFRITATLGEITVDRWQLLADSIYWGIGIVLILLLITVLVLRNNARTHVVMIELVLVGFFGAVSSTYASLRDINIEWDRSAPKFYDVKIRKKQTSYRTRRSARSYSVYVDDWNKKTKQKNTKQKKINVVSRYYNAVSVGDSMTIEQRTGYLGYRWATPNGAKQQ